MSDTRSSSETRSSLLKKYDLSKEEKTTDNPKSLLANYVQVNETVAASQPDDSLTVTHIKQNMRRRSSRRSSSIGVLNQTPHGLLQKFFENAPEEPTVLDGSSSLEGSVDSDAYLTPGHQRISNVADDNQTDSSVSEEEIVRKMPRTRYKADLEKISADLEQQSEKSEIQQKSWRKKIRNKITAEDIASGIKLSQKMAAETEKSCNVTQATKTDASLFYPSMNTLNAEKLDDTSITVGKMSPGKADSPDRFEENEDSHDSQHAKYSKRKRSFMKDESSKVEESFQKSKMLRLKTNMDKVDSAEDAGSSEVEKMKELPNFVSEADLTEVAYTVEVGESKEAAETVQNVGNEKNESQENEERIIKKSTDSVKQEKIKDTEKSALSMFKELNKMLQDESMNTENNTNDEESEKTTNEKEPEKTNKPSLEIGEIKRINSAVENSSEQADLSSQSVSKTSEVLPGSPGSQPKATEDSKDPQSKLLSILEDFEALIKSRDNKSDVSKVSSSKADSSYLESSNRAFESNANAAKERPLLDSKARETLASSDKSQMSSHIGLDMLEIGAHSVEKANSSAISHETSTVAFQTEMSGQSNEVAEKGEESIKSRVEVKERTKDVADPSVAGNLSTDEHDELFPSSPKETTSSGHSRSASPASSEADKATQGLNLPKISKSSVFVEMKSPRSNALPASKSVLTNRTSSKRKSSTKMTILEKTENKSYSVASPNESLPSIENVTKDAKILPRRPLHSTISAQQTTEKPVTPKKPQGDTNQNKTKIKKNTYKSSKQYTVPPKVTSLLMEHYSGVKIPNACLPELGKLSEHFIDNLFEALNSYAKHASHKRIEDSDVELYLKRVGFVNKNKSLQTLIREFLPLEDQQLLIPVARSGNVVTGGLSDNETKKKKRNQ